MAETNHLRDQRNRRKPTQKKRVIPGNPRSPKKRKTKTRKSLLRPRNRKKRRNPKSPSQAAGRDRSTDGAASLPAEFHPLVPLRRRRRTALIFPLFPPPQKN